MEKHFVTFLSPGTFFSEEDTKEIAFWDVDTAVDMSKAITQRYNAKPYGFYFSTRSRGPEDLDSQETSRGGMYYLGGKILTLDDVKARNDPKDKILISNMECNGWDRIIENTNSWKFTGQFKKNDTVL